MRVWGISDLHLSFAMNEDGIIVPSKPMDVFGDEWRQHYRKIETAWETCVEEEDLVLIPGDISWAMNWRSVGYDLAWISRQKGRKVLSEGNHDYWWETVKKVRSMLPRDTYALSRDALQFGALTICATKGAVCPGTGEFTAEEEKLYRREVGRLELALQHARKLGGEFLIAMLHYPPTNECHASSGFTELLEEYGVDLCIYGHLHGEATKLALEGQYRGVEYRCVSCDHAGFKPVLLL